MPPPGIRDDASHHYDPGLPSALTGIGITLGVLAGLSLAIAGWVRTGFAPAPRFHSDPDSTIIAAKVRLATSETNHTLAFVGDSSCLINVDTESLKRAGHPAVNLGTLSYLGLDAFGLIAQRSLRIHPSARLLLVVHPDCLRMTSPSEPHRAILEAALGGSRTAELRPNNPLAEFLGFEELRSRLIDRVLPEPLKGRLGTRYGFTEDLERSLLARFGTMDETSPGLSPTDRASAEYRLAARIEGECRRFRDGLPGTVRLGVIVSPVPRSHALRRHTEIGREMLSKMEGWLGVTVPFPEMPWVLEDGDFGTVTHLRPEAARRYSRLMADRLATWKP